MGNFYVNVAVKTEDRAALHAALPQGNPGLIGPAENGWTVVSTEKLEAKDEAILLGYGARLPADLNAEVARVLGLPGYSAGFGFDHASDGQFPHLDLISTN